MDERKQKIIELMLMLDLRVNEYKILNKKYEENKEKMNQKELSKAEKSFKKILDDINKINIELKKLNKE